VVVGTVKLSELIEKAQDHMARRGDKEVDVVVNQGSHIVYVGPVVAINDSYDGVFEVECDTDIDE
jgi:hypothetical protein